MTPEIKRLQRVTTFAKKNLQIAKLKVVIKLLRNTPSERMRQYMKDHLLNKVIKQERLSANEVLIWQEILS